MEEQRNNCIRCGALLDWAVFNKRGVRNPFCLKCYTILHNMKKTQPKKKNRKVDYDK